MSQTLATLFLDIADRHPESTAQYSREGDGDFHPVLYRSLREDVAAFARGLALLGVRRGDRVGLISENRREWLVVDLAILGLGAADVPRGNDTMPQELQYILESAGCEVVLAENQAQLDKVLELGDRIPLVKVCITLDGSAPSDPGRVQGRRCLGYGQVLELGRDGEVPAVEYYRAEAAKGSGEDMATLIFTSGTTGTPKGVMLNHRSFLNQVKHVPDLLVVGPGDIWLCVLPVWHSFERVMQYVAVGQASALAYSKPLGKIMLRDFAELRPTWMASVPRIWEALQAGILKNVKSQSSLKQAIFHFFVAVGGAYAAQRDKILGRIPQFRRRSRVLDFLAGIVPFLLLWPLKGLGHILVFKNIHKKLGGRFVAGISGGGALPEAVDKFFSAAGILLLEGYGITETAPVLGVRAQKHPVPGTVGPVFPEMEVRILDPEGKVLQPGQKGVIHARGPQVMMGYWKNEELTRKVIDQDSWFNTGDLGMLTWNNEIKILGREKDTIVLRGGENVEPLPIEDKIKESAMISAAVVLGQDQKYLAALLVPDREALAQALGHPEWAATDQDLGSKPGVQEILRRELDELISSRNGFRPFERIVRFVALNRAFEVGRELSAKQEYKRHTIQELYTREIQGLFP